MIVKNLARFEQIKETMGIKNSSIGKQNF